MAIAETEMHDLRCPIECLSMIGKDGIMLLVLDCSRKLLFWSSMLRA